MLLQYNTTLSQTATSGHLVERAGFCGWEKTPAQSRGDKTILRVASNNKKLGGWEEKRGGRKYFEEKEWCSRNARNTRAILECKRKYTSEN